MVARSFGDGESGVAPISAPSCRADLPDSPTSRRNGAWRIVIVELSDEVPRRRPDLPALYVSVCQSTREERLFDLQAGAGPEAFTGKYVSIREDLLRVGTNFETRSSAKAACKREKARLARLGHSINGDATVWNTYVVDLDPSGVPGTEVGYVYVGQTSLSPEDRFAVHKGPKPDPPARDLRSGVVNRRGIRLNRELMNQLTPKPPKYTLRDALQLERVWATKLHEMGYRVEAGDATPARNVDQAKEC